LVAYKLGDNTAKDAGRLTLNPIKHIDIIGLIMMAIFQFGWAKPVPINMNKFKNPKAGMAITALAGPVSNVILAAFMFLIYGFIYKSLYNSSEVGTIILQLVYTTAYISCALAVLNIIPIPPLDGSKVLFSFLPSDIYYKLMRYEQYGFILLILLISTNAASPFLTTVTKGLFNFLSGIAQWAYLLTV
jgi:Zn-dependent protease